MDKAWNLESKRLPDDQYHWARELYEVPLGLVGTPALLLLVPFDLLDEWRSVGRRFVHNAGLWWTLLDTSHNVRWSAFPDP